jgi:hypothetical protein
MLRLRDWWRRRRQEREARRLLAAVFSSPELLRGTSLKQRHASRWILLDFDVEERRVVRIYFGILRHPRPYAFSRQSHKVLEQYLYDVEEPRISRLEGHNISRASGRDAD